MLEKMARELALNAVERVKPDTYTNVVDEIWLYRAGNDKYRVSDYPGIYSETPVLSSTEAIETMVAMMAEQAGALVVVPDDAPMDSRLLQIADMLVNSADVPTGPQDVADGAAIVGTVKRALDWLAKARCENADSHATIMEMSKHLNAINAMLAESPDIAITKDDLQVWSETVSGVGKTLRYLGEVRREAAGLRARLEQLEIFVKNDADLAANRLQEATQESNRIREQLYAAQQEIGALTERLSSANRTAKRWEDEAANNLARYEGMEAALRIVLEQAGVGK